MATTPLELDRNLFKERLSLLRQQIKLDATEIRSLKQTTRLEQRQGGGAWSQSQLAKRRHETRIRQLVSGLMRGKTWEQMESNHSQMEFRIITAVRLFWNREVNPDRQLETPLELRTTVETR